MAKLFDTARPHTAVVILGFPYNRAHIQPSSDCQHGGGPQEDNDIAVLRKQGGNSVMLKNKTERNQRKENAMEKSKRKMKVRIVLVTLICAGLSIVLVQEVRGKPSWATTEGNGCMWSGCHSSAQAGRMEVTNGATTVDLGTQLNGSTRGPLKTYLVEPGDVVTLSAHVTNGTSKYATQLKDLEKGGQLVNQNNHLIWNAANDPGNVWTRQEVSNPPYFTKDAGDDKGISWAGTPVTYTFDLQIDVSTPPDVYDLVLATAGQSDDWYQEEHFYLEVLCPYSLPGDTNGDCKVDLVDFALVAQNWLTDCGLNPADPACISK